MVLKRFIEKASLLLLIVGLSACATAPGAFDSLKETGYTMSPNFSAAYEPGTLIQTMRAGKDGKDEPYKTPVVITTGVDCFPGKVPMQKDLALTQSRGKRTASLDFGASLLSNLMNINTSIVRNSSLSFEKPQVIYYPISDIFGQLSPKCVNILSALQQAGNKIEWFEIIYEVVVANSLSFKLEWGAGATAEARLAQTNEVQQQVSSWVDQPQVSGFGGNQQQGSGSGDGQQQGSGWGGDQQQGSDSGGYQQQGSGYQQQSSGFGDYQQPPVHQSKPKPVFRAKIGAETSNMTELRANGTVVVGYRSAALRPIK